MSFWDYAKAQSNITKHGVTFAQASTVLEAEERWFTLGMSGEQRLVAISHGYQPIGPTSVTMRIIR